MAQILLIANGETKVLYNTTLAKARQSLGFSSFALYTAEPNKGNIITDVNDVQLNDTLFYEGFVGMVTFFDDGHLVLLESLTNPSDRRKIDCRKCLYICPASELKGLGLANPRLQSDNNRRAEFWACPQCDDIHDVEVSKCGCGYCR